MNIIISFITLHITLDNYHSPPPIHFKREINASKLTFQPVTHFFEHFLLHIFKNDDK